MQLRPTITLLASLALGLTAFAGDNDNKTVAPTPLEDGWKFSLSLPGWIPWLEGDTGINGQVGHVDLGPDTLVPKIDMIVDVRGEARKGRLGILGEFLYMSLSDGIGTNTAVKKIDVQIDQTMADLGLAWRLVEGPRGYLDLVGGVRYTNLFQQLVTQTDSERIDERSAALVDALGARIATALSESQIRELIAAKLSSAVDAPELDHPSTLPVAPLGGRLGERLRERIQPIIDARKAELAAAVKARAQAVTEAARAAAQQRVNSIKKDLTKKIAHAVDSTLDTRVARTDDWWDPYVGLRGRYNINEKFYLTAKGDIGGFGVGCKLTWTAEAALGWQLSEHIFSEVGYRAFAQDYEDNGLTYDMITHGPQVTLGVIF